MEQNTPTCGPTLRRWNSANTSVMYSESLFPCIPLHAASLFGRTHKFNCATNNFSTTPLSPLFPLPSRTHARKPPSYSNDSQKPNFASKTHIKQERKRKSGPERGKVACQISYMNSHDGTDVVANLHLLRLLASKTSRQAAIRPRPTNQPKTADKTIRLRAHRHTHSGFCAVKIYA